MASGWLAAVTWAMGQKLQWNVQWVCLWEYFVCTESILISGTVCRMLSAVHFEWAFDTQSCFSNSRFQKALTSY